MAADGYAAQLCGVLELAVAPFRYHQSPPIVLQDPNHVTYFHGAYTSCSFVPFPRLIYRNANVNLVAAERQFIRLPITSQYATLTS